jgi:hypothetical protein
LITNNTSSLQTIAGAGDDQRVRAAVHQLVALAYAGLARLRATEGMPHRNSEPER